MQSFSSRIWNRVAVSIFYDDNRYTTGPSLFILSYLRVKSSTKVLKFLIDVLIMALNCLWMWGM